MTDLPTLIQAQLADVTAIRRDLHAHPQLAFEETYAAGVIARELERLGIAHVTGLAETGVAAWLGPAEGEAVALRADIDALPITEQTGAPWASQHPGLMHACGHDGHTAILLGAARVLKQVEADLPRPVKLIFQPGEERAGGGRRMIEAGVLSDAAGPAVRSIFGLHGMPYLKLGQFATRPGPLMAATDDFRIVLTGRGGHAAMPQFTLDPLPAAAQLLLSLQTIVSRSVDPVEPAVLSVAQLHAGEGAAANIIPAAAELAGTIRTLSPAASKLITRRMRELAEAAAAGFGGTAQTHITPGYPATVNDPRATELAMTVATDALGPEQVFEAPHPVMASEDFAYYGQQVPACFGFLGACPADVDHPPPLHHPQYDFNDDALAPGIRWMVEIARRGGV
jgi:hippurate hydrolase